MIFSNGQRTQSDPISVKMVVSFLHCEDEVVLLCDTILRRGASHS